MNPIAIILTISLLANAALGYAYLGQRDATTQAVAQAEQAQDAATACSKAVDDLDTQAKKRKAAAKPRIEAAAKAADSNNRAADKILSTPAAMPGNDCQSAQARVDNWWQERTKP